MFSTKGRQLRRHRQVGIEGERGAVEYEFVLAADFVEVNQRQPAFGHARHRDRQPQIVLVARVRRAVRHDQDFRAGFRETFDDVFVFRRLLKPDVLANGNANPDAADGHRSGGGAARKQALFIEDAVVRQIGLERIAAIRPSSSSAQAL